MQVSTFGWLRQKLALNQFSVQCRYIQEEDESPTAVTALQNAECCLQLANGGEHVYQYSIPNLQEMHHRVVHLNSEFVSAVSLPEGLTLAQKCKRPLWFVCHMQGTGVCSYFKLKCMEIDF